MADRAPIRDTGALPVRANRTLHGRDSRAAGGAHPGFTLTELLIVLTIIILVIGIAIPAVNLLSGRRSIATAQNQLSSVLSLARSRALALQRETGLFFYVDPDSDRFAMRMVDVIGRAGAVHVIDMVPGTDVHFLPAGVGMQFPIAGTTGAARSTRGYDGFNRHGGADVLWGGAILFDRQGRLLIADFGLTDQTALGDMLGVSGSHTALSHLGVVFFERGPFIDQFTLEDPASGYPQSERDEESWLDENGRLLLINRYSGTFVE